MKRMLPVLCIALGIVVFLFPTLNDRYESYRQQKIMEQWAENMKQIDSAPEPSNPETPDGELQTSHEAVKVSPLPGNEPESGAVQPTAEQTTEGKIQQLSQTKPVPAPKPLLLTEGVEGILTIDKIQLKLPILTDATPAHMKVSVASIAHTGKAGAIGNYAIAGHRNLTYGKNFNRLDEVGIGDLIEVDTGSRQYSYRVQEKQYVLPEEVWVLRGNGKDREITLITCDPMIDPTHRLIVKGKLVESG